MHRRGWYRAIKRALLLILAVLFLFESWLWRVTGAAVAWLVARLPLEDFKGWVTRHIEPLSPWLTLGVFIIPALVLLPLNLLAGWLLAGGRVLAGVLVAILAKCIGLGVTSFLFALCKPKLLELGWLRWLYEHCLYWYTKAKAMTAPYMRVIRGVVHRLRARLPRGTFLRRIFRVRTWAKGKK